MENKIGWEEIFNTINGDGVQYHTMRSKIRGGWIVNHSINCKGEVSTSCCFLPDENHEWLSNKEDIKYGR